MKGTFKIIELDEYDVLIQKHWSQTKKELKKYGKYQLQMTFWIKDEEEEIKQVSCKVIMGYDKEILMIEDYDNSNEEKIKKLLMNWLKFYEKEVK